MSKLYVDEIVPRDTTSTNKIDLSGNSVSFTNLAANQTFADVTTTTLNATSISSGTIGGNVVFPQGSIINVTHLQNSTRTVLPGQLDPPYIYWNAGNITKKTTNSFLVITCLLNFWLQSANFTLDRTGPFVRVGGGAGTTHYDGVTATANQYFTRGLGVTSEVGSANLSSLQGTVYHYVANQSGPIQIEFGQHPVGNYNDRRIGHILNPTSTDAYGVRDMTSDAFIYEVMYS